MPPKKIRFNCKYCGEVIVAEFPDEFQEYVNSIADKWPYPFIYPHNGHYSIIYVDQEFHERGVVGTTILYDADKDKPIVTHQ
jgi:hypothetical protein